MVVELDGTHVTESDSELQMGKTLANRYKCSLSPCQNDAVGLILSSCALQASIFIPNLDFNGIRLLDKPLFYQGSAYLQSLPTRCGMDKNLRQLSLELGSEYHTTPGPVDSQPPSPEEDVLEWSWEAEHADRKREANIDASMHHATPFEVDRKLLKDVVFEKMGVPVLRILFLSSGMSQLIRFNKGAYLITLADKVQLVARVARRFMPRLKTESEVATMQYLREHTNIPVPIVYHYDSNPYNRLGGEYILMSKARGVPLSKVYHSLSYSNLVKLLTNLAEMIIPLLAHRFSALGSLYFGPDPHQGPSSTAVTPKAVQMHYSAFPFSPRLQMSSIKSTSQQEYHIGPIISWPFFGSNRGDLSHPNEINRGPWSSTQAYFSSCVEREVTGVIRENEGRAAPHKIHLDPDEIHSSRHHHLKAVPGDESDDSDEWDMEESEDEWEGPGDAMYRDYRRMQRTTFLVAHIQQREECVKKEMARWKRLMDKLMKQLEKGKQKEGDVEEFGLDCHDLSLENVFVDEADNCKITCIIDWESTTTRPLWACAHLPAFLQSTPFVGKIFRAIVAKMAQIPSTPSSASATSSNPTTPTATSSSRSKKLSAPRLHSHDLQTLAREWLYYESAGMKLRMAHRFAEWDGWEEGLVNSMIGEEEHEDEWFKEIVERSDVSSPLPDAHGGGIGLLVNDSSGINGAGMKGVGAVADEILKQGLSRRKVSSKLPFVKEMEKEQVLDGTGDICGGRGGELGRRLEAWLTVNGHEHEGHVREVPVTGPRRRWDNGDDEYDGEAE
ncbi:hypothetical protein D9758_010343 [Tetrapyrgos nigripes]|uniref:Aminoglycoside phosphotransferase domain-containing protein n=1 Tax=Tetrapyrgos nigripes TaxID=182062 RepID=A0A8H5D077_9AGAR|nr:hypothetical protein D9758_010343 [Tetrapyrgos nigripes]